MGSVCTTFRASEGRRSALSNVQGCRLQTHREGPLPVYVQQRRIAPNPLSANSEMPFPQRNQSRHAAKLGLATVISHRASAGVKNSTASSVPNVGAAWIPPGSVCSSQQRQQHIGARTDTFQSAFPQSPTLNHRRFSMKKFMPLQLPPESISSEDLLSSHFLSPDGII